METLEILFFLFTIIFSTAHSSKKNSCPSSNCRGFSLDYPFTLQNEHPENDCTYTTLSCNDSLGIGTPILNLPYAGTFYVRFIEYYQKYIELYDPDDCLMSRLMDNNLNLSSSPFKAIDYEKYTFYTCPSNSSVIGNDVFAIDCLSNKTNSTVASALIPSDIMLANSCKVAGSWLLPVQRPRQFEYRGINDGNLYLTWNSSSCKACEDDHQTETVTCGSEENSWTQFAHSPYLVPTFVATAMLSVICLLQIIKTISDRNESESATATSAPPQRSTTGEGLDESKIRACTELVVLSESIRNMGNDSSTNACSICLEIYADQDSMRKIAKCEHCFHADCIELWLTKNRTCPVCRTIVADDVEL